MPNQSSTAAETTRKIDEALSKVRGVSNKLGADCASTLRGKDLRTANIALQPVFELNNSLMAREPVELQEALVYLCDGKLCELLLSLLRRWPWAAMRRERAVMAEGLDLLVDVLDSLCNFLNAAANASSSQQASAYDQMSRRCLSEACLRALGCAGEAAWENTHEYFKLAALPVPAQQ